MGYAQELIDSVADVWARCCQHPFVAALASGELPRPKFRDYLVQDTLFLAEYTKVFAICFVKADDISVMRHLYGDMAAVISDETQTHIAYLADFGLSEADALRREVLPANRAYLDFMLGVARGETWLEGFMSAMPCTLSYFHVARHALAQAQRAGTLEGNYYRRWAEYYSGPEYQAVYDDAVAFIDQVTAGLGEAQDARLRAVFRAGSEHELAFWDMAWQA
ncbi:MAG: thiaminase II [Propionibacteriaceae bacterium]|jgi:thiaminase/transcriptional activator TenA|nr:thiaminase II [Propionibacteriaceae bacterium]